MVDLCADDVTGQKVRRALDSRELAVEGVGDGLGGGRLGQSGDGLDQDVAVIREFLRTSCPTTLSEK